jgi:lysophospholipase L1-like esterase
MRILTCFLSLAISMMAIIPAGSFGTGRGLPAGASVRTWKFDLVPGRVLPGFLPVPPSTPYSAERGYGFDFGSEATGLRSFYFSVRLPEGNYNVTVTLGDPDAASVTTIKAECRRLMVEKATTAKGEFITRRFTVHVRDSLIHEPVTPYPGAPPPGTPVRLKLREYAFLHWDDKLTLEFSNVAPRVRSIEIEPAGPMPTVFLAGNSTVVDQAEEPWAAWGQMIPVFFQPGKIAIANYAESGETLKAFVGERRLAKLWTMARPGDYLFIEFAHNDQKPGGNHLDPFTTYKEELNRWVSEARGRGLIPVLVTSMHRRNFDSSGRVVNTLGDYPAAMRQVAAAMHTGLVDLNAMSRQLYEAWGPERSVHAFVHYPAHTFPGQDQELKDDTHFNSYGAYELAKCVAKGIRDGIPELSKYLLTDLPSFDPAHPDPMESWALPPSGKINVIRPDGN